LVGLLGLGGAIILLWEPDLGLTFLTLVAFLVPFELDVSEAVSANPVMALVPLLFFLWLLPLARRGEIHLIRSRVFLPLLVLVVVVSLSLLYGNARWNPLVPRPRNLIFIQLGQWGMYTLSALAFFLAAHQSPRALKWATFAFISLGFLVIVGRYGGSLGLPFRWLIVQEAGGHSLFYVTLVALAGGQGLFNRRLSLCWRVALVALAVATPLLLFWIDRDLMQNWLPALVVLYVLLIFRSPRLALGLLIVAVLLGLFLWPHVLGLYDWEREWRLSGEGRLLLWGSVLDLAMRQPILGLGLTTYHHYHRYIPLPLPTGAIYLQPSVNSHNVLIDVFAQMGLVGLAVFAWTISEIACLGWRVKDRLQNGFVPAYARSALALLVGTLVASMFADLFVPFVYNVGFRGFRFSVFAWLFLGGLVALEQVARERHSFRGDTV
jgi:hypothetical protein